MPSFKLVSMNILLYLYSPFLLKSEQVNKNIVKYIEGNRSWVESMTDVLPLFKNGTRVQRLAMAWISVHLK